jgi:hypothetical protein
MIWISNFFLPLKPDFYHFQDQGPLNFQAKIPRGQTLNHQLLTGAAFDLSVYWTVPINNKFLNVTCFIKTFLLESLNDYGGRIWWRICECLEPAPGAETYTWSSPLADCWTMS